MYYTHLYGEIRKSIILLYMVFATTKIINNLVWGYLCNVGPMAAGVDDSRYFGNNV